MPKVTDTYERAYAACATLAARGINPTVKTVAEFIGTNSPAIISPAIKDWRQSVAVESLRRLEIPEVPERLVEATVALWRLAVEEAQLALAKDKEALARERAEFKARLDQSEAACQSLRREHEASQERAGQESQALKAGLDRCEAALRESQAARARAADELAQAREANAGLAGSLAETQRNLARQQAEWEEKFNRDHAWHLSRIAEERERARQEAAEKTARLEESLALARQNIASLNGYLDQSAAATGELRGELKAVREEKERLLQELAGLRDGLAEAARGRFEAEQRLAEAGRERESLQEALRKLQGERDALAHKAAAPPRRSPKAK